MFRKKENSRLADLRKICGESQKKIGLLLMQDDVKHVKLYLIYRKNKESNSVLKI